MGIVSISGFKIKKVEDAKRKATDAYLRYVGQLSKTLDIPIEKFVESLQGFGPYWRKNACEEVIATLIKKAGYLAGSNGIYINEQQLLQKFNHYKERGRIDGRKSERG